MKYLKHFISFKNHCFVIYIQIFLVLHYNHTSVPRKCSKGGFLTYPGDQWRKVNFCPLEEAELWENRGKAQAGMKSEVRRAKPSDVGEFFKKPSKMLILTNFGGQKLPFCESNIILLIFFL